LSCVARAWSVSNERAPPARFARPPVFPRLPVIVYAVAGSAKTESLTAEVDTGADTTLVPLTYLHQVQAEDIYTARLRGHGGTTYPVSVYLVDLEVAGKQLPGVEVVGDPYSTVILLGRNVLNHLNLLIAGPDQRTILLPPATVAQLLRKATRKEKRSIC